MTDHEQVIEPSGYDRRTEVEHLLALDDTVLGRFWRHSQEGLSKEEMAEREDLSGTGWTSIYDFLVRALRDGRARSPSGAREAAARIYLPEVQPVAAVNWRAR